jgi:predicted signal transduction protein with EAL and GGDEF domain
MSNNELLIDGNTSHTGSIGRLLQQRIIGELTLIAGICVASWFLSQYLNIFEWVHEKTRGSDWLDEVLVVGCVFAVCFAVFCVRRWHEMTTEIASRLTLQDKLVHDAHHDPLTQLPNSNIFLAQLAKCVKQAEWPQDYKFGVVFVDVDRFKSVNDSFGHSTGDQLLVQISERLLRSSRQDDLVSRPADIIRQVRPAGNDILARLGGDEFVILLDDVRDPSDGIRAAERVQHSLLSPFLINGRELQITVSTGVAVSATGYSAAEDVLRDADTAMYRAKALGKSQYQMCDAAMHAAAVTRLKLEDDLREATKNGELRVYFQPIVSLQDRCIRGFEALIRWQRPGLGLVAPGEFIAVAEETGLIVSIGSWVLREACTQIRAWHLRFPSERPHTIAVNVSTKQFIEPDLVNQVDQILHETGLGPRSLIIEITESVAMQDVERTARIFSQLKLLGVHMSIDDFGTGYSSLSYLRHLPWDILKIDRSFVSEIEHGNGKRGIVHTMIDLAHDLIIDVVAEGVETVEQADALRALGCQYAQGYFFSKPLDKDRMVALLGSSGPSYMLPHQSSSEFVPPMGADIALSTRR